MIFKNNCPICNSINLKTIIQEDIIGHGHYPFQKRTENFFTPMVYNNPTIKKFLNRTYFLKVSQCNNCFHLFQNFILKQDEELKFHQSFFKNTEIKKGYNPENSNIDDLLIKELNFISSLFSFKTILDIGSSTGEFCLKSKQFNIESSSLDLCLKTNEYLRNKNIECFESITEINKRFDVIRVSHVLSHIHNNIEQFITDLIEKLKDKGIIYFIDHLNDNENIKPGLNPLLHVNLFSNKSFDLLLRKFNNLKLINESRSIYGEKIFFKIYRRI